MWLRRCHIALCVRGSRYIHIGTYLCGAQQCTCCEVPLVYRYGGCDTTRVMLSLQVATNSVQASHFDCEGLVSYKTTRVRSTSLYCSSLHEPLRHQVLLYLIQGHWCLCVCAILIIKRMTETLQHFTWYQLTCIDMIQFVVMA